MNKTQLVSAIAEQADLTVAQAERVLTATLDSITETLTDGDVVTLIGFGSFGTKARAARKGRNPQTGAAMLINASVTPYFKAGKALKELVDTTD